jgi:dihydrofolate reductase
MIKCIVAIDSKRGLADDHGIPWRGKLPTDVAYFRDNIKTGILLMGYGLYKEMNSPFLGGTNYVATSSPEPLREGYVAVADARAFLQQHKIDDVWNLGGAGLFNSTIDLADELYITKIEADFHCTKFFPQYERDFTLVSQTPPQVENGIKFSFTVYKRK